MNPWANKQLIFFNGTVEHCLCLFPFQVHLLWACSPACEVVSSCKRSGWWPACSACRSVCRGSGCVSRGETRVSKSWRGGAWMPFSQVQNAEGEAIETEARERDDEGRLTASGWGDRKGQECNWGTQLKTLAAGTRRETIRGWPKTGLASELPQHMVDGTAVPLLDWELRRDDGWGEYRERGIERISLILFLLSIVHPSINSSVHLSTVHPSSTYPLSNIHPHSIHSHSIHPQSIYPSSIINPSSISTAHPLLIHPPIHAYIVHPSMGHPFIYLYWATGSLLSAAETVVKRTPPAPEELVLWLIKIF